MIARAQVTTQAKKPVAPPAAHIPQPPVAAQMQEAEPAGMAGHLGGAGWLGYSLREISVASAETTTIQRQEVPEEGEEEPGLQRELATVHRQEAPEEEEELQMQPDTLQAGSEGGLVPPQVEAAIGQARGGGQPLDGVVQAEMGETLGHDFSAVRVHTDAEAYALNERLSAKAFTTGRDIFFRQGAYESASSRGRELIGHELAHVVQQSTGRVHGGGSGMSVRPAGDASEQEADSLAKRTASKAKPSVFPQAGSLRAERRIGSLNAFLEGSAFPIQRKDQDLPLLGVPVDFLYVVKRNRWWLKSPGTILNEANQILTPRAGIKLTLGSDNQILVEEINAKLKEKVTAFGVSYASKADAFDMVVREKAQSMRPRGKISLFVFNMDFPGVPGVRGKSYHTGSTFPIRSIQEGFARFIEESNWRGVATVYYPAAGRIGETVAHEVGHVLLGSGRHHDDAGNLMADATVRSGTNLESDQIAHIRAAVR